ncbi:MAG TPA: GDP-mannose 4,6-dehydratase, partial [Anaerolineales bacterium]|nr:GDP-mannose 4,6-dehydratase [Anaerolineales bacterium]
RAVERIEACRGQAYNIGGGPQNVSSLLELIYRLEARQDRAITLSFCDWRPGDQKVYVSDIRKARRDLGWSPKTSVADGVEALCQWVEANRGLFADDGRGTADEGAQTADDGRWTTGDRGQGTGESHSSRSPVSGLPSDGDCPSSVIQPELERLK